MSGAPMTLACRSAPPGPPLNEAELRPLAVRAESATDHRRSVATRTLKVLRAGLLFLKAPERFREDSAKALEELWAGKSVAQAFQALRDQVFLGCFCRG